MSIYNIPVVVSKFKTEIAHLRTTTHFFEKLFQASMKKSCSYYFWVDFSSINKEHNHFYLFGPYSRYDQGLSIAGGTLVFVKFFRS